MTATTVGIAGARQAQRAGDPMDGLAHSVLGLVDDAGRSRHPHLHVLGIGIEDCRTALIAWSRSWRDVVSVTTEIELDSWHPAHEANLRALRRGVGWVSVFDLDQADPAARDFLVSVRNVPYFAAPWSRPFKIVDSAAVVLEGPVVRGERTVVAVTDPALVRLARQVWRDVSARARHVSSCAEDNPLSGLSDRQLRIARLMAEGQTDEEIARALGISVRTVRSEIAALLGVLGVRSRFAAGQRMGELGWRP